MTLEEAKEDFHLQREETKEFAECWGKDDFEDWLENGQIGLTIED